MGDFYEKNLRFGLVLGQLAILKKIGSFMNNICEGFFHVFRGKKMFKFHNQGLVDGNS